jgi:hypothetical protein
LFKGWFVTFRRSGHQILHRGDAEMKKFSGVGLGLSLALLVVWFGFAAKPKAQTSTSEGAPKPVVVELFTSEGCSSCPSADALLQKLEAHQPIPGAEIIALEEHVDYWNHDGWVDPYSSPEWTERQQDYVAVAHDDAYTPEMVVDGRSQFVGNNGRKAEAEIDKAAREVKTEVSITAGQPDAKGGQRFTVSVGKLAGGSDGDTAEVWLAVTEDGLHSAVSRGENSGRVLQHVATLRSLRKMGVADGEASTSFTGNALVKFNPHWNLEKLHLVVFLQEKKSRRILGAASTVRSDAGRVAASGGDVL